MNKRSQIAEGITWIVATMIIVVILSVFLYLSGLISGKNFFGANSGQNADVLSQRDYDLLATKSFSAFLLSDDNGKNVYSKLSEGGKPDDFITTLAQSVFYGTVGREYAQLDLQFFPKNPPNYFIFPNTLGLHSDGLILITYQLKEGRIWLGLRKAGVNYGSQFT